MLPSRSSVSVWLCCLSLVAAPMIGCGDDDDDNAGTTGGAAGTSAGGQAGTSAGSAGTSAGGGQGGAGSAGASAGSAGASAGSAGASAGSAGAAGSTPVVPGQFTDQPPNTVVVPDCAAPPFSASGSKGSCVATDAESVTCNVVTNSPCKTGEACDFSGGGTTTCFEPPNDAKLCEACNPATGPACGGGMNCQEGVCMRYCCNDSDCSEGFGCSQLLPKFKTYGVGLCVKFDAQGAAGAAGAAGSGGTAGNGGSGVTAGAGGAAAGAGGATAGSAGASAGSAGASAGSAGASAGSGGASAGSGGSLGVVGGAAGTLGGIAGAAGSL